MVNEAEINILLKCRIQIQNEVENLRDALAIKTKALGSLNDTIDLLRGWNPENVVKMKRMSYDDKGISEQIKDLFTEPNVEFKIEEICNPLIELGMIPSYSTATRNKVAGIIREIKEIEKVGNGFSSRYRLKRVG